MFTTLKVVVVVLATGLAGADRYENDWDYRVITKSEISIRGKNMIMIIITRVTLLMIVIINVIINHYPLFPYYEFCYNFHCD